MDLQNAINLERAIREVRKLSTGEASSTYKTVESIAKLLATLSGIPLGNAMREVKTIYDSVYKAVEPYGDKLGAYFDTERTVKERFETAKLHSDVDATNKDGKFKSDINKKYYDLAMKLWKWAIMQRTEKYLSTLLSITEPGSR
jgi:hypothetical protein